MARRKNLSTEEKIVVTKETIEEYKSKIIELQNALKELEDEKEIEDLRKLKAVIDTSGKTIEDAIKLIQK